MTWRATSARPFCTAAGVWGLLRNPANRVAFLQPVRAVIWEATR
jgi:hypothetical protein